jgi:hypothetical protein
VTLALLAIIVLAIVVFAFVLEPVLRARGDRVVLDAVSLPRPEDEPIEDAVVDGASDDDERRDMSGGRVEERRPNVAVPIDRPAGSDAS